MTWVLRGLALVFALGAIIAGLIGYRLSTQPPPPPSPAAPAFSAVQAAKPLAAGQPIRSEDITLAAVAARPVGGFANPEQVVGQKPTASIAAGEFLTQAHFPPAGGHFQRSLRPGERAVAIKVDEVVGLGGFAQPGDWVDVLLYLRGTQETGNASSAQVVLAGVRLLAFGEAVQPSAGEGEGAPARAADKAAGRPRTATSAVLAVPEGAASRLMLAANSGTLRLALRPEGPSTATPDAPGLIHLSELSQAARPVPSSQPARSPKASLVLIHEGDSLRTAGVPR